MDLKIVFEPSQVEAKWFFRLLFLLFFLFCVCAYDVLDHLIETFHSFSSSSFLLLDHFGKRHVIVFHFTLISDWSALLLYLVLPFLLLFYLYDLRWAAAAAYDADVVRSSSTTFSGVFYLLPVAVVRAMYFSSFSVFRQLTLSHTKSILTIIVTLGSPCVCFHLISVVFETLSCAFIHRDHWFKFIYVFHSLIPAPSSHHTNGLFKNNIKKRRRTTTASERLDSSRFYMDE